MDARQRIRFLLSLSALSGLASCNSAPPQPSSQSSGAKTTIELVADTQPAPAATQPTATAPAAGKRPNILLITMDTTRADRLGCYGFGLARTPTIDGLARDGVRCSNAITVAPITAPAHSSILTGLFPPAHGVRDNGTYALSDDVTTIAERLKSAGYATHAIVSALVLNRRYNLTQGFDEYEDDLWDEDEAPLFMIRDRQAPRTAARVRSWLDKRRTADPNQPFFLWVHFFDPHQPYEARVPNSWLLPSRYDAEIYAVDLALKTVFENLRTAGELDDTIIVLTADHGESLGEHGEQTHAIFVYDATVHVPQIWRYPKGLPAGKVYDGPVRAVDIVPTLLDLTGLPGGEQTQGADLAKAFAGKAAPPDLPQYSESLLAELGFGMAPLYAIRHDGWKYIRAPKPELYNLRADPNELTNLYAKEKTRAAEMDQRLDGVLKDCERFASKPSENPMDQETLAGLAALGYVAKVEDRASLRGMDPKDGIIIYNELEDARHLAQKSRWSEAEAALRRILEKSPANISARNILALCLIRQNRFADAEKEYVASLDVDPRQARVLHMIGVIRLRQNDLDGAEKNFHAALEITPRFIESMVSLGFVALQRGNGEQADDWYRRAIAEDPGSPRVLQSYADLYYVRGDFAKAGDYYRRTLDVNARNFSALLQLGLCQVKMNDSTAARETFERAAALQPQSWKPTYNLACVAALCDHPEDALRQLDAAFEQGMNDLPLVEHDPDLDSLRSLPEFQALLERAQGRGADSRHE